MSEKGKLVIGPTDVGVIRQGDTIEIMPVASDVSYEVSCTWIEISLNA